MNSFNGFSQAAEIYDNQLPDLPDSFYQYTPTKADIVRAISDINAGYTLTFDGNPIHINHAREIVREDYMQSDDIEEHLFNNDVFSARALYLKWLNKEVLELVVTAFDDYGCRPAEWSES